MFRILVFFTFDEKVDLISRFAFFVVMQNAFNKVALVVLLSLFCRACVPVMVFASHCFHLCLNYTELEKAGRGMSSDIGPEARERTSSNCTVEFEVGGWELCA